MDFLHSFRHAVMNESATHSVRVRCPLSTLAALSIPNWAFSLGRGSGHYAAVIADIMRRIEFASLLPSSESPSPQAPRRHVDISTSPQVFPDLEHRNGTDKRPWHGRSRRKDRGGGKGREEGQLGSFPPSPGISISNALRKICLFSPCYIFFFEKSKEWKFWRVSLLECECQKFQRPARV